MTVIKDDEQRQNKSYLSKITGRPIMNPKMGSVDSLLWEQFMPADGFIPPHYHEEEEILTLLSGSVEVTIDGVSERMNADATVLFQPHATHSIRNTGSETARMLAYHPTGAPRFVYTKESFGKAWNSNSRILLNQHFSTAEEGWNRWFFDQLDLPNNANILELGCGSGDLWSENEDRVPAGWDITLSDFSSTMLNNARRNLRHLDRNVVFEQFNANAIPIEDNEFDAVIANHLLFYTADWESGIAEMARVLKPGGKLYASTTGQNHLREMAELVSDFDSEADFWGIQPAEPFYLENGSDEITKHFNQVETRRFPDRLEIDEADALVDFVLSTNAKTRLVGERLIDFINYVESHIKLDGKVTVTKDEGLFLGTKAAG